MSDESNNRNCTVPDSVYVLYDTDDIGKQEKRPEVSCFVCCIDCGDYMVHSGDECYIRGDTEMFKKRRGINIPYNRQGLIHFTCLDVQNQPEYIQRKILNLCNEVAGEDCQALYEAMTSDTLNITGIALKHYISEKKIYNYRKEFYERW